MEIATKIDDVAPLGLPGQLESLGTLQADRGDEVQAVFAYQWAGGAVLLAAALAQKNDYVAIWCEHHEDYLAEVANGSYDLIQVKTLSGENATWHNNGSGFLQSIGRFAEHERKYGSVIRRYVFFSNARPYIPGATTKKSQSLASSPMRLRDSCTKHTSVTSLSSPYREALAGLAASVGITEELAYTVLRKLDFQQGPPLETFRESLTLIIGAVPGYNNLTVARLIVARNELISLVQKANSLDISAIDCFASVLASDGRPEAAVRSKCIPLETARMAIAQTNEDVFRYAEAGGYLQLGRTDSQKDVLRQKMNAGYLGNFFDSIWLQAQAAEQRLLERAIEDPESTLALIDQLAGVVLVECQNAEALADEEHDLRKRGMQIYRRILKRTEEVAKHEKAQVFGEPVEMLRGIAGILSGSCKFAWGTPLDEKAKASNGA